MQFAQLLGDRPESDSNALLLTLCSWSPCSRAMSQAEQGASSPRFQMLIAMVFSSPAKVLNPSGASAVENEQEGRTRGQEFFLSVF